MALADTIRRMKTPASIWEDRLRLLVIEIEALKDQLKRDLKDAVKNATSEALFQDFAKIQAFKDEVKNSVDLILKAIEEKKQQAVTYTDENIQKSLVDFNEKLDQLLNDTKETVDSLSSKNAQQFKETIIKIENLRGPAGKTPVKGIDYFDGKDLDPQTVVPLVLAKITKEEPDTLVEKINKADKKVKLNSIEGLQEEIAALKRTVRERNVGGSGGSGNWIPEVPTGSVNGSNTTFTLTSRVSSSGKASFVLINGQVQRYTTHYTISDKTLTFTTAPETGDSIFIIYQR